MTPKRTSDTLSQNALRRWAELFGKRIVRPKRPGVDEVEGVLGTVDLRFRRGEHVPEFGRDSQMIFI